MKLEIASANSNHLRDATKCKTETVSSS